MQVDDPYSAAVYEKHSVSDGQFVFTTKTGGEYKACFTAKGELFDKARLYKWVILLLPCTKLHTCHRKLDRHNRRQKVQQSVPCAFEPGFKHSTSLVLCGLTYGPLPLRLHRQLHDACMEVHVHGLCGV